MKYKLINSISKKETICEKVTIDGFDYYVSILVASPNDIVYSSVENTIVRFTDPRHFSEGTYKKVIATNNPNIDIPKVVSKAEVLAFEYTKVSQAHRRGFIDGYNKAKETHPFSEEDMTNFLQFYKNTARLDFNSTGENHGKSTKDLLQLWKEQKPKIVYYE